MAAAPPPLIRPHPFRSPLLFLSLLLLCTTLTRSEPASGDFNCAQHDPRASQNSGKGCLHNLLINPDLYEPCRSPDSNVTCYIFLQEPPFINFDVSMWNNSDEAFQLQKPFKCGEFANQFLSVGGIGGIAFELHKQTSSRDDLCMWGGHADYCGFNQLVDYTQIMADKQYRFAVTGLLLELPSRQCSHHPSAPLTDSAVMIVGQKDPKNGVVDGPFAQLIRPFEWGAWCIFGGVLILFIIVCLTIAVRFHWFRGRSLITAFFIFAGERDEAMAHEANLNHHNTEEAMSFATKYGLAMTLFRIALLALIGIFALFYEVAVVNFLFQQQNQSLSKPVKVLAESELKKFAVLKDSALENVWNATVLAGRKDNWGDRLPWLRCPTATECIEWTQEGKATYMVTFEIVGKHLLVENSDCSQLTIFKTKDVLYQFNGGWLYNKAVKEDRRMQVDRELVGLRIEGKSRKLVDSSLEHYRCEENVRLTIGVMIIFIPCLIFVFPPLLCSVLVLVLWKKQKRRDPSNAGGQVLPQRFNSSDKRFEEDGTLHSSSSDLSGVVIDGPNKRFEDDGTIGSSSSDLTNMVINRRY